MCGLHRIDVQEHTHGGVRLTFPDECPSNTGWRHVESGHVAAE